MTEFHEKLKELVAERGLTMKELSDMTGLTYITLRRFFKGNSSLTHEKFILLLEALDIDLDLSLFSRTLF